MTEGLSDQKCCPQVLII